MRLLIKQILRSNGCSATIEKFFLILPTVQISHPLTLICLDPLKRHLGGMAFETEGDIVGELKNWFVHLAHDFFRVCIYLLLSRWKKCIDLHGDYVETWRKSDTLICASFKFIP
ncbi:histone-lysine n-methyltransferase setmar [Elysia marginata]|uniref:Histone-lysine n-methyltransferase setmar n=1 Tax=Elysia marginata TaxID=1093978 RepID=A0AAV4HJL3_9GAST|nr:histone-lysine n-methyltransferase setmar [Elysia marginata]